MEGGLKQTGLSILFFVCKMRNLFQRFVGWWERSSKDGKLDTRREMLKRCSGEDGFGLC